MTVALRRLSTCPPANRRTGGGRYQIGVVENIASGPLPVKHSGRVFTRRDFQSAAVLDDGKERGDRVCKKCRVCGSPLLFVNINRSSHNLQSLVVPFFQCRTRRPASSKW